MKFFKNNNNRGFFCTARKRKSEIVLDLNAASPSHNLESPLFESTSKQESAEATEINFKEVKINSDSSDTCGNSDDGKISKHLSLCKHDKAPRERTSGMKESSKMKFYGQLDLENSSVESSGEDHSDRSIPPINKNIDHGGSGTNREGICFNYNLDNFLGKRKSSPKIVTNISKAGCKVSATTKSAMLKIFPGFTSPRSTRHQYGTVWTTASASKVHRLDVGGNEPPTFESLSSSAHEKTKKLILSPGRRLTCKGTNSKFGTSVGSEPTIKTKVKRVKHKHQKKTVRQRKERQENVADQISKSTELVHMQPKSSSQKHLKRSTREGETSLQENKTKVKDENIKDANLEKTIITLWTLQNCVQHQTHCQSPIYQQLLQLNNQSSSKSTCRKSSKLKPRAWGFKSIELDGTFSVFLY